MPTYEVFGLNAVARLVDAILIGATTLEVTSTSGFPSTGNFRISIGLEILLVTGVSAAVFTVLRAQEGTTAAAYDGGSAVTQILTAGGIQQVVKDSTPLSQDTARPVLNTLVDDAAASLNMASFSWVNQGSATGTDLNSGGISLALPTTAGISLRSLVKTAPTAPYTLTVAFIPQTHDDSLSHVGILFRESSTSKLMTLSTAGTDQLAVYKFTNDTTFSTSLLTLQDWPTARSLQWFKIEDDNVDLKFFTGMDGINWQEIASETRTTFMAGGPNQIGFDGNSNNETHTVSMALVAWEEI